MDKALGMAELSEPRLGLVEYGQRFLAVSARSQDLGELRADEGDPIGQSGPTCDGEGLGQRVVDLRGAPLLQPPRRDQGSGDLLQRHRALAHLAEALVDRQLLLA